ncbi:segregation and condensation protein A [Paramaledivibacter caminithermalis]|jgi:segregation and condensation protein A|uniref:Segregation and condensation protein A n=1 Tax=Paramaledivibacter caminithermalis (strain DSM 15212 / CIP 107654 / DViRD3) TaxID=1121301 RepID=A0A1M6JNX8_PARC5|nr:segregation/condensation protein A [Paramaledivibacter caminithermalis]SHJ48362.1 condensin subunit ScpA [Paramaledivibacter caminithermalis DSM 15212]
MDYEVKLEAFEGPFDLLFHLIEKNEIDIYNIPISQITDQYLDYLNQMKYLDMEVASEFLVMAATLLEIKSKTLLPNPVEEQLEFDMQGMDPRRDLVIKLIEYKKYKNIANFLKDREDIYGKVYFKAQDDLEKFVNEDIVEKKELDLKEELLINAVKRVMNKISKLDMNRKKFFRELKRDIYTVEDKISFLKSRIEEEKIIKFHTLFNGECCRLEVVVTFLALLELLKLKIINIRQDKVFDEIYLFPAVEK